MKCKSLGITKDVAWNTKFASKQASCPKKAKIDNYEAKFKKSARDSTNHFVSFHWSVRPTLILLFLLIDFSHFISLQVIFSHSKSFFVILCHFVMFSFIDALMKGVVNKKSNGKIVYIETDGHLGLCFGC